MAGVLAIPLVSLAATFGYTTPGGTTATWTTDSVYCSKASAPLSGTVTSISFYSNKQTTNRAIRGTIYASDGNTQIGEMGPITVNSASPQWWTMNGSISIPVADTYFVCVGGPSTSGDGLSVYWDGTGTFTGSYDNFDYTYPTWPTSMIPDIFFTNISIYATYTPSAVVTSSSAKSPTCDTCHIVNNNGHMIIQ